MIFPKNIFKNDRHIFCAFAILFLFGCVTHPEFINKTKQTIIPGNPESVKPLFHKEILPEQRDGLLYLSERARLNHISGDYIGSNNDVITIQQYERSKEEGDPVLQFSRLLDQSNAFLTNDNALPYQLRSFEKVMLYQMAAFNCLQKAPQDLEAAINTVLDIQKKLHQERKTSAASYEEGLQKSENQNAKKGWAALQGQPAFQKQNQYDAKISTSIQSFENASAYYFCGLFYEIHHNYSSAMLAYQFAFELIPQNKTFRDSFIKMAQKSNQEDILNNYSLAPLPKKELELPPNTGEVIVFFESGWIPAKHEFNLNLPFPTFDNNIVLIPLSLPYYPKEKDVPPPLNISFGTKTIQTEAADNIYHFAVKDLHQQMPIIATRMFLRAFSKSSASYMMLKKADDIDNATEALIAKIFVYMLQIGFTKMEQPDLRSFLTLPHTLQIARIPLSAGDQPLKLNYDNQSQQYTISIKPNQKTILHIIANKNFITCRQSFMP